MFSVITGLDGAGKTTALEELSRRGKKISMVSPEFCFGEAIPDLMGDLLHNEPRKYFHEMKIHERAAFLALHVSITTDRYIIPALEDGREIICDSYWYKYAAKEALINPASEGMLRGVFDHFPEPDRIVYLDIDPKIAWERKSGVVTPFESGTGETENLQDRFVKFQNALRESLLHKVPQSKIRIVSANQSPNAVITEIERALCD